MFRSSDTESYLRGLSTERSAPIRRRWLHGLLLLVVCPFGASCAWNAAGDTGCQATGPPRPLPAVLDESSGVASSRTLPGVLWTHNDGHEPVLFAVDSEGELLARFRLKVGRIRDVEDVAVGECPGGTCIYLADTGDNQEVRPQLRILRIPEPPVLDETEALAADVLPVVLPDGPRDIEALFILPGEDLYLVSKGRNNPQTVYHYPPPLRPGVVVSLEAVQDLSDGPMSILAQITGADASADGTMVAIRTYWALDFYRVEGGRLVAVEGGRVALRTLEEPQGEAVGFGPEGQVFLTTEAGSFGGEAALRVLQCDLRGGD